MKKNEEIKEQINSSSLNTLYTIHTSVHSLSTCVPSFNLLGLTVSEKSVTKKMLMFENWGERKMKNKGMNKQQQPDSGIHNTSAHCPCVCQVSTV